MGDFLQLVISGTAIGAIYALAALGFTLLWQASNTINFAQGEFVMLPAFVMLFFLGPTVGAPLWLAFLLTCLVSMLLLAGVIVIGLQSFLNRTLTGRAMQAVAQNTDAARVLGINVRRMVLYTFLINAVLAVVAALLVTPTYLAKFDMGESIGLKAFYAAIIGGFNQTRGALLGGVLVGVLENLTGAYVSPAYKEGVALILFLIVIIFRPEGLLGKAEERKV